MTNEELIAEARKWPRELEGNLINDLAAAPAAVPAPTEAAWRKAIADQVRRNCTPSSEAYAAGGDQPIYAVCDWIENPPEWSSFTAPGAAPKTQEGEARPEIVVLCGSTRFYDEFQQANFDLTMAGKIVLSVGFYPHAKAKHGHGEGIGHNSAEKVALDELHKRKIDLADRVLVLNVDGYIGESTRSEIDYAVGHDKPVEYLVPVPGVPVTPVFEAMGLPPLPPFPSIHPEGGETK